MASVFRTERETFRRNRAELLRLHHGEWVLIKGREVHGVFETEEEALRAGYGTLGGDAPFLVRRIERPGEEVTHTLGGVAFGRLLTVTEPSGWGHRPEVPRRGPRR